MWQEKNAAAGRKVRNADGDDMTPPRSLSRYAPAVRAAAAEKNFGLTNNEPADREIRKDFGGRMRSCRFHQRLRPLTSITEI